MIGIRKVGIQSEDPFQEWIRIKILRIPNIEYIIQIIYVRNEYTELLSKDQHVGQYAPVQNTLQTCTAKIL
jgi:hypothetical protein